MAIDADWELIKSRPLYRRPAKRGLEPVRNYSEGTSIAWEARCLPLIDTRKLADSHEVTNDAGEQFYKLVRLGT
jgi:hypothetical protein